LLGASSLLSEAAIDKYSFTRDAYLQYRRNQVFDGNPPDEDDLPDPSAEPAAPSAK
jgi:phospholipid-binding lipoprotein MlaA